MWGWVWGGCPAGIRRVGADSDEVAASGPNPVTVSESGAITECADGWMPRLRRYGGCESSAAHRIREE